MLDMCVIILTKNEEINISRCINSVKGWVNRIIVLDSYSVDKTTEIAKALGAEIFFNEFKNYGNQFKFSLDKISHYNKWIFRLDADEEVSRESKLEIIELCSKNENTNVNGIVFNLEITFLGKKLKHGGNYPFRKLCIFKKDEAYMEDRDMDEQIILKNGKSIIMKSISYHYDYKNLTFWINKHNSYSSRAAKDFIANKNSKQIISKLDFYTKIRRFFKIYIFYKIPSFISIPLLFIYKYIILLGFLDGKSGFYFIFFQTFWYRTLINAKLYESKLLKNYID